MKILKKKLNDLLMRFQEYLIHRLSHYSNEGKLSDGEEDIL